MLRFLISIAARRVSTSASGAWRLISSRNSLCVTWNRVSLCQSVSSPSNPTTRTGIAPNDYGGVTPGTKVGISRVGLIKMKKLNGIHHISAITADATRNVLFYTGVMGLRLVTKTVNQDDPTVYHLYYADEGGDPGSDLTFFEYPGAARGRVGPGCAHRVIWRVGSADALAFWAERLSALEVDRTVTADSAVFADFEG